MKIKVTVEVEAPDDATHYAGDLLDGPVWWKFSTNSGTITTWYCYSMRQRVWMKPVEEWMYHGLRPHGIKQIPENRVVEN